MDRLSPYETHSIADIKAAVRRAESSRIAELEAQLEAARKNPFQRRVDDWMLACFGEVIVRDVTERNHRFLEEALELVQSTGCTACEAHQLVDYVYGRPVGETNQKIGGVMVTLSALCSAVNAAMQWSGDLELMRISAPEVMTKIRAKQAAKPKHSPLPIDAALEATTTAPGAVNSSGGA